MAAFTAAASSASAMTGSAPSCFNSGAESRDRVSANTSCRSALSRRTSARPIAPLAPAIMTLIAASLQLALQRLEARPSPCSPAGTQRTETPILQRPSHSSINSPAASRSVVVDRGLGPVISDDVGDQPRRLGLARIGADDVMGVGRLGPALAGGVDPEGLALDLGADRAREDIREDEAGGGMAVRRRETAGAVVHLDDSEGLARDIGQLLAEDLLHGLPFAGRGLARRVRSEGESRRDDQARQCFRCTSRWKRMHGW